MIAPLSLGELASACDGAVLTPPEAADVALTGLAVDSRAVKAGDLFAALPGARVDGHDFVKTVGEQGANAALVQRVVDAAIPQLVVDDSQQAVGAFGRLARQRFDGALVGITGSAGKTTAKNLLAAVLAEAGEVLATEGNRNNELGVPLTLASLVDTTEFAVLEMGAGKPGDIKWLVDIARPTIAVLLNVAPAHVEFFGSLDAIADTKGAIFDGLPDGGLAVFNGDQIWCEQWRSRAGAVRSLTFGLSDKVDYRAIDIHQRGFDGVSFTVTTPLESFDVSLALPGKQGVYNALAAIAVAHGLGLSPMAITAGLASVKPGQGRGRVYKLDGGATLVDDSYNANPLAVQAAIDVLASAPGTRRLVLGAMLELGEQSAALHEQVGRYAREAGIDELWVVGAAAAPAAAGFGSTATCFDNLNALTAADAALIDGLTVLVKGSRGAALDTLVEHWIAAAKVASC